MVRLKTVYECSNCGEQHTKWQGKCNSCDNWNCLHETNIEKVSTNNSHLSESCSLITLDKVELKKTNRISSGIYELDRVLGNEGFANSSVTLIGGDPGIGKSTLILQTLYNIAKNYTVLYVTGEESISQVAIRAKRLNLNENYTNLKLLAEINLSNILNVLITEKPSFVVIDSIQTMYTETLQSAPGSVSQVRECASILTRFAKKNNIILIMIGHVTKDGVIAGPRVLEHIVDTVLYFEGEGHSNFRLIRSIKNRFGSVNELGIFSMTDKGLKEINNPSALFLSSFKANTLGSVILISSEGSRPLLVEVQALVDNSYITPSKRLAVGVDNYRLALLIAIMQRHLNLRLYDQDIFINIVGGIKINEPAIDLAVVIAILSSFKNKPVKGKLAVFGEIGLSGEIRTISKGQERIKEAIKLGFETIIVPKANAPKESSKHSNCKIIAITNLSEVMEACF